MRAWGSPEAGLSKASVGSVVWAAPDATTWDSIISHVPAMEDAQLFPFFVLPTEDIRGQILPRILKYVDSALDFWGRSCTASTCSVRNTFSCLFWKQIHPVMDESLHSHSLLTLPMLLVAAYSSDFSFLSSFFPLWRVFFNLVWSLQLIRGEKPEKRSSAFSSWFVMFSSGDWALCPWMSIACGCVLAPCLCSDDINIPLRSWALQTLWSLAHTSQLTTELTLWYETSLHSTIGRL